MEKSNDAISLCSEVRNINLLRSLLEVQVNLIDSVFHPCKVWGAWGRNPQGGSTGLLYPLLTNHLGLLQQTRSEIDNAASVAL
jgi:hypothetical protein